MGRSAKNVRRPVSHVQKLSDAIKKLRTKQATLYKLDAAGLSLASAKVKKASVLEAHKACEKVMEAALELKEKTERLEQYTTDLNTALKEVKRLHTTVLQYKVLPRIKLYGRQNEELTFWGSKGKTG